MSLNSPLRREKIASAALITTETISTWSPVRFGLVDFENIEFNVSCLFLNMPGNYGDYRKTTGASGSWYS